MNYVLSFMTNFSDLFLSFLSQGGYWALSIVLIVEAFPVIGSFIPGHILIVAAGFLAKLGILNLWIVLISAIIATVIGDIIGFILGRAYGYDVLHKIGKFCFIKKEYLDKTIEKTKGMIDKHTGKTIVLGKFSPVTRAFVPFLVGASGVHIRVFWLYNVIGAIFWIFASVILGYIFGASYHAAAAYSGKLMGMAVVLIILILWGFRVVNRQFHVFKKYELFVLGLNIVSLWALVKTVQDSFSIHSFMSNFDIAANIFMVEHVTPLIAKIAFWVSDVGGTLSMIFLGLAIGGVFLFRCKWRRAAIMIFTVLTTSAAVLFLKDFFMRVRPHNALLQLPDESFPSGHASLAAAFFVALVYVSAPHIKSWVKRELWIVLCVFLVALVGFSRVVINVHWASDVIAGWALGVFIATGTILLVRYVGAYFIKK